MEVSSDSATVIAGRYRLDSLIGEGGMASVWRAKDLTLARSVAVKILFARDDRDEQALVDQFLREARIAAAVQHRNVVHTVDFGTTEEGRPFMVMELLEGESLGDRMHRPPPMTVEEVIHVASLTLRGLAAVHEAGIIHRDLKPDNIYLRADTAGSVFPKILDFGISRSVEPSSGRRSALTTKEGIIVGTPEYMSPEQARGIKDIDYRTDIYSIGVIMYESLTGRLPFSSENIGDLIIQIVTSSAPPVSELNPQVPQGLSDIVEKAMSRSPKQRFADAAAMQQAIIEVEHTEAGSGSRRTLSDPPPRMSGAQPAADVAAQSPVSTHAPTVPTPVEQRLEQSVPAERRSFGHEVALDRGDPSQALELAADPGELLKARNTADDIRQLRGGFGAKEWAFVAVVVAGAVAAYTTDLVNLGSVGFGAAEATPAEVQVQPLPETPQPPKLISIHLRNVPQMADVTVDGKPVAGDAIELPKNGATRIIRVTAEGKVPWQVVHTADQGAVYDVWLAEEPKARTQPRVRRAAKKKKRKTVTKPTSKPGRPSGPPSALHKLDF